MSCAGLTELHTIAEPTLGPGCDQTTDGLPACAHDRGFVALRWLGSAVLGLALTAALAPASAHAVTFSGPTNFAAGDRPARSRSATSTATRASTWRSRTTISDNVSILLGDGSGGFSGPTNFAAGDVPYSVAVGDFNGDARLDLAVANDTRQRLDPARRRQRGLQRRRPTSPSTDDPYSVAVGDFNGDSRLDLAAANVGFDNVSILLGDGSGGFTGADQLRRRRRPPLGRGRRFQRRLAVSTWRSRTTVSDNVSILLGDGSGGFTGADQLRRRRPPLLGRGRRLQRRLAPRPGDRERQLRQRLDPARRRQRGLQRADQLRRRQTPRSVAVGDFNGDSRLRPRGRERSSDNVSILLGDGSGGFTGADQLRRRRRPRLGRGRRLQRRLAPRPGDREHATRTTSRSC